MFLADARDKDIVTYLIYQKLKDRFPYGGSSARWTLEQTEANYEWLVANWADIETNKEVAEYIRNVWRAWHAPLPGDTSGSQQPTQGPSVGADSGPQRNPRGKNCYRCDSPAHLAKDCPLKPSGAGTRKNKGDRGNRAGAASSFGKDFGQAWRIAKGR